MSSNDKSSNQVFALSDEERLCFGWDDFPVVLASRTPEGRRHIPTREVTPSGQVVYGAIETFEPPPGVDQDAWETSFGSMEDSEPGRVH